MVELELGTVATAAAGAAGATGEIPKVITEVPVVVAPLASVVTAVIVNWVGSIATVDVPEIVPVAVSKINPAGSGPVIEKTVLTAPEAVTAIVTGVIGFPTEPLAVVVEAVSAEGVMIVEAAVVAAPDPAALVATADT